jgi:Heparinase II/III-like protein/Heparinase II/III N-terminus
MATIELIRRLRGMSLPELRFRLAQRVRIGRERIQWTWTQPDSLGTRPGRLPRRAPEFYLSPDEISDLVAAYHQHFPHRLSEIVEEAERHCAHRIKILGYPEINYGRVFPWRKDLVHGIESGLDHWSQIAYLDFSKVGDSKIVWEPNRHQHLVTLALTYRLTGEQHYADECASQWRNWHNENPYLRGINWASSLELAFRAWSWIWMFQLLAGTPAMTDEWRCSLNGALAQHADFILKNLSTYFSPNTHLLGEGFALFVVGLLFPELQGSAVYLETGRKILSQEITKQVREDGVHAEQSIHYHAYATDFFLCASILADRNGYSFSDSYKQTLEHMVDFLMYSAWPSGSHPAIGDTDGGNLLPFGERHPNDYRSTMSTAAVYFERGDFKEASGQLSEQTLWLLGPHAATRYMELGSKPPRDASKLFSDSGFVIMRNDWRPESNMLIFDVGPQGMGGCGHGHADALSVLCSAEGTNWLVDPGTFVYTASKDWRDYFRSTRAHNTLVVDGEDQAIAAGPFKWQNLCPAQLDRWTTLPHLDYASGFHEGYRRLEKPVVHRRRVAFVKPDRWFLLDDLIGEGTHALEFFFHFPPDAQLEVGSDKCSATKNNRQFLIMADPRLNLTTGCGEQGVQGWFSRDYGHRGPAAVLMGETRCSVPARFPWILWPGAPKDARLREVPGRASAWALETDTNVDYFAFSHDLKLQVGQQLVSDAEFAFLRHGKDGKLERLTLIDGSWLNIDGAPSFRAKGNLTNFDLVRQGTSLEIQMQPVTPFKLSLREISCVRVNGAHVEFTNTEDGIELRAGN